MEDVALLFHLVGAFLLVGGTMVAGIAFEAARRRETPSDIALLLGLTRIGVLLVALAFRLRGSRGAARAVPSTGGQ